MTGIRPDTPVEEPLAGLERDLIRGWVEAAGHRLDDLLARDDDEARRILAEASRHASERLAEVETRAHYVHELHGRD